MTHYPAAAHPFVPAPAGQRTSGTAAPMRQLYLALSEAGSPADAALAAAAEWLTAQLAASELDEKNGEKRGEKRGEKSVGSLPSDGAGFAAWHAARQDDIDEHYKQYVAERRAGAPRRLFSGRAHALHYLRALAPARLTDGAWLYGVLARWDDAALRPLILTYLEELGNGVPDKNHVVIFQQLIDAHGCARWQQLDDHHFYTGVAQLALAHHAERFLPELIGYNLGCEHASLDTLVAAYEMNELGIDPYYFSLHVNADNSATGHARLALEALRNLAPAAGTGDGDGDGDGDPAADFMRRVDAGFRLHARAPASADLLAGFDLQRQVEAALAAKHVPPRAADGAVNPAHALLVADRALGEWLADPQQVPALLIALEQHGWVVRGGDPFASRLWSMIAPSERDAGEGGEGGEADHGTARNSASAPDARNTDTPAAPAPLAGLFSAYELALLADWIAADPRAGAAMKSTARPPATPLRGAPPVAAAAPPRRVEESAARGIIRHRFPDDEHGWEAIANELTLLEARVVASSSKEEAIALLTALMAPSNHHTSTGLMATRMFSKLYTA